MMQVNFRGLTDLSPPALKPWVPKPTASGNNWYGFNRIPNTYNRLQESDLQVD